MSSPQPAALVLVSEPLLTPGEVAALFRVDPRTVWRWGNEGRLDRVLTAGGHGRYKQSEVQALLAGTARSSAGDPPGERGSGGAEPGSPSPAAAAAASRHQESS